jgi:methyl-accepting chemotaxis protein WspA
MLIVVGGLIVTTLWVVRAQASDGLVINLAGRQRMLTQKFTKELLDELRSADVDDADLLSARSRTLFEMTLLALWKGGTTYRDLSMTQRVDVPAATNEDVANRLGKVNDLWTRLQQAADSARASEPGWPARAAALKDVRTLNVACLREMDSAVGLLQADAEARVHLLKRIQYVAAVIAVLTFIVVAYYIRYRICRPLADALRVAESVAAGDLTSHIQPGRKVDEVTSLLSALKRMTNSLNELVGQVQQSGIRLHSTATELAATSREQTSVANAFGASVNQIAAAVRQIAATGSELVQTMDGVSRVAASTSELAVSGQSRLQEMESTMRSVDESTAAIADKLGAINERTSNITGVVTTITKVADQTNLLSVNAALEAEKAGDYGVGFLVVAREIRRLADQTAAATLDIGQMVQQTQAAVSAGVMEMDRFSDRVRRSMQSVVEIGREMSEIIQHVGANTASFERVNEGMRQQSDGADQISEAMTQLNANATQIMAAIEEYAQAAEDLRDSASTLKSSIASFQLKS